MIDMVVHRSELRDTLIRVIGLLRGVRTTPSALGSGGVAQVRAEDVAQVRADGDAETPAEPSPPA
jgi:hypothetical protein